MNKILYIALFVGALIGLSSCNDLDQYPSNNFTDDNFWVSVEKAQLVLNMAYSQMYGAGELWNDEKLSDNMVIGRNSDALRTIRNGQATASLGEFASQWSNYYRGMKTCNIFMDKVDIVPNMDAKVKARMKAEMRLIRAFQYFKLTNYYGDVPFFTSDISLAESRKASRTAKATVRKFIHDELEAIVEDLPAKDALPTAERGRLTKAAAIALNARVYLYDNDFLNTVVWSEKLIKEQSKYGSYALFGSYAGLFTYANEYNSEIIYDVQYVPILRTWSDIRNLIPRGAGAPMNNSAPTQSLVENYLMLNGKTIFEQGSGYNEDDPYTDRDPRLDATIVYHGSSFTKLDGSTITINIKPGSGGGEDIYSPSNNNVTCTGYYVRKHYDQTAQENFDSGMNVIMIRYAEILLNYAEAKFELGEMNEDVWNMTIRKLRERAGFSASEALDYNQQSGKDMREVIRNERRSELAFEGLRYYDIMRWGEGKKYLEGTVYGAKYANNNSTYIEIDYRRFNEDRDYLWAVPLEQIQLNPNLAPNNKGY